MDTFDDRLRAAAATSRVTLTIAFERGTRRSRVTLSDADGAAVAELELEQPEELSLLLARLVALGFATHSTASGGETAAPAAPPGALTPPPRPKVDVLVAGVDGYRRGWVAVSLDPSGDVEVSTHASFVEVLALRAQVIAVDIPIDPAGRGARPADAAARAFVRSRASSVFPTPPRAALEARTFAEANERARTITGRGISQQAFALARKILEVHELAAVDERVIEMHPEVSFCALAGGPLPHSKHSAEGLAHRRSLLAAAGIELPAAYSGVPETDLLDAAAGAWSAARYASGTAQAFPPEHRGRLGAIWA
jgi:predicted RNase H-like nuclease